MFLALALAACRLPHPAVAVATLPAPTDPATVDWDAPGPLRAEVHVSADWSVPRSGVLDLHDPAAAGLPDEPVAIVLPVVVLRHPTAGTLIVDTGIDTALARGEAGAVRFPLGSFLEDLVPVAPLAEILGGERPDAVLLTHLHADHVLGLPDVPGDVPVWIGPDAFTSRTLMNAATGPTIGAALAGHALQRLSLDDAVSVPLTSDVTVAGWDLLGDGSLWALHVPGHTPESLAFVARTVDGPLLVTGDASHTRWGWDHGVAPGTYTEDPAAGRRSFEALRAFAAAHPAMRVQVGHDAP
ncbi:MAG: MBL fold metallo-hydrolase [Myxococcota bacterium]